MKMSQQVVAPPGSRRPFHREAIRGPAAPPPEELFVRELIHVDLVLRELLVREALRQAPVRERRRAVVRIDLDEGRALAQEDGLREPRSLCTSVATTFRHDCT